MLPAGLVHAASQEAHLASTNGVHGVEGEELANAFTPGLVQRLRRFRLRGLKSCGPSAE